MARHAFAVVLVATLAVAWVKNRPHRTFGVETEHTRPNACVEVTSGLPDACGRTADERRASTGFGCATIDAIQATTVQGAALRAELACFNTERHPAATGTSLPHAGFDLHVVEFDDQGRPWNRESMERTLQRVQERVKAPSIVLTFIHGWKNNGAATALIEGIRTAVRGSRGSTVIFVGHSFGGALLLSAVGNVLNGALESARREANGGPAHVELDGALFILVNPALESSRFRNLFTAATSTAFSRRQLPVMLTLASEGDVPVRLLARPDGEHLAA